MKLVFCDGGLANRLNVLIFALILKEKFGHDWELGWPRNTWCGAGFERLFELDMPVHAHPITYYKEHEEEYRFLVHENQGGWRDDLITFNKAFVGYPEFHAFLERYRNVFYYNNLIPGFATLEEVACALRNLRINRDTFQTAAAFCQANGIEPTVYGLHIRKTDFADLVNDEELFKLVSASTARFFVCSDDEGVNNRFSELPNCSVFKKKYFPTKRVESGAWLQWTTDAEGRSFPFNIERSEESVVEGLIDLLILSRTTLVKASHSTFFTMAGLFQQAGFFQP